MTKILSVLICCLAFLVVGCAQEQADIAQESEPPTEEGADSQKELEQAPEEMLSSFSVSGYSKGGKKQWDLEGKSADIQPEAINLQDVTGKVYGEETNMTIVADEGSLDRLNNNVHLEKNVFAKSDDGASLRTDYLDWDAENQKLSTEAEVWLERGMLQAEGRGIVAQPALSLVELRKDVTVTLAPEDENAEGKQVRRSSTVITCDGPLEVDYQNNQAVFWDNVKVTDERGEIFADKMDVFFSTEGKQSTQMRGMEGMGIERVVAEGSVEIHRSGNRTYSEKAVYDTQTGRLTLTGTPKLVIYSTEGFQ